MWNIYHEEKPGAKHLKIGRLGEDLAAGVLKRVGHKIVEKNYRKPYGEIDIVTNREGVLHFVEVKSISGDVSHITSGVFGPEDHMNYEKRQRQKRVINTYLAERRVGEETDWQIDLACVYLTEQGDLVKIEWLEDIILD
ncbi:MAG: YraN family protein [Candidatus Vogelbacteria bacterium]|nr:YraN family protein [Candidatus Vogelbacteria bacterium]